MTRKHLFLLLFFILVAASVGVTLYINGQKEPLPLAVKARVEAAVLEHSLFPARPVWWEDDQLLVVGISPGTPGNSAAETACKLALQAAPSLTKLRVEAYDVVKIQQSDSWTLLGSASCSR